MSMGERENLHEGHRDRMIQKLFVNTEGVPEHELLEVLLFFAIPRKDTNALAHKLLRTFGNLEKIFSASAKELYAVDGVGQRTAVFIRTVGEIYKTMYKKSDPFQAEELYSFEDKKWEIANYFKEMKYERFLIKLYDEKHREITSLEFENANKALVTCDIPEIAKALAINKPSYVIIAHNHTSDKCEPSELDDLATIKINLLCLIHGVELYDHVIVTKNDVFSYFHDGRMEYIRQKYDIEQLLKSIKEKK